MKVTSRYASDRLEVQLTGELDHHTARQAVSEITELIESELPRELTLDMGRLSFMDSSGIALILRVNRRLTEDGAKLTIINPGPQAYKVLQAAGILRMIEVRSGGEVTT